MHVCVHKILVNSPNTPLASAFTLSRRDSVDIHKTAENCTKCTTAETTSLLQLK